MVPSVTDRPQPYSHGKKKNPTMHLVFTSRNNIRVYLRRVAEKVQITGGNRRCMWRPVLMTGGNRRV